MPVQNKKSTSSPSSEKSGKPKKKKKKSSSKRSTSKRANSSPDSSSEGNPNTGNHNRKNIGSRLSPAAAGGLKSNPSSGYDRTSSSHNESQNSSSWVTPTASTSDGRSTSSSGENLGDVSFASTSQMDLHNSKSKTLEISPSLAQVNESLRWTTECEDPQLESERLKLYKMNRRKRYLGYLHESVGENTEKTYYA